MENPKIKKGDLIIVVNGHNGAPEGIVLEVMSKSSSAYIVKNPDDNRSYNIYPNGSPKDEIILADREARKKYLSEMILEKEKELSIMKRDLNILVNFSSEEAYTASKISEILKNKDNPKAIEDLLKELKKTNYL